MVTARTLHLTANLLDYTALLVDRTGVLALDGLMSVIRVTKNTMPATFDGIDETDVFVEATEAAAVAGVDHPNCYADHTRRADALRTAARSVRHSAYRA